VGHKGKVDLKYIQEGHGGFYYRDHLAVLGLNESSKLFDSTEDAVISTAAQPTSSQLNDTSGVVLLNSDAGPNSNALSATTNAMSNLSIDSTNSNRLNIENNLEPSSDVGISNELTTPTTNANANSSSSQNGMFNQFSVGDKVKITLAVDAFKQMQEGHGGWNYKMAEVKYSSLFCSCLLSLNFV
jgi:hypothetical protein